MKKDVILIVFTILCLICLSGCKAQTIELTKNGFYFDTAVQITVFGTQKEKASLELALQDALTVCEKYENMLSRTMQGSDIERINSACGEWVMVSDETIRVIYTALNYCELSEGRIDITVAPVKDLWDFSSPDHKGSVPSQDLVSQKLLSVDYRQVEIDGNKVRLTKPGAQLDLGFIAKGFIADEVKASLIQNQVSSAIIDLGGNILVLGEKPNQEAFKIGIRKPFEAPSEILTTVDASDSLGINTIVTSGIYERYFISGSDQMIYHHVLDAKTGYPVRNNLQSVTILTNNSMNADALSTTCLVMGLEWSREFLSTLDGVDAVFVTDNMEIIDTRK